MAKDNRQTQTAKSTETRAVPGKTDATNSGSGFDLVSALQAPANPQTAITLQRSIGNTATTKVLRHAPQAKPSAHAGETTEIGMAGGELGSDLSSQLQSAQSGGNPLDDNTNKDMSQRFGADFGGVRIHTDSHADRLNRSLSAQAFTHGSDLYFRNGAYSPGTASGRRLLAHELTHVVQQGAAGASRTASSPVQRKITVGAADDRFEREADAVAQQVLSRTTVQPATNSFQRVQRQPAFQISRAAVKPSIQRLFGKKDEAKEKKKQEENKRREQERDESLTDASTYERNLGKYAYNRSEAQGAAKTMANRMAAALVPGFKADVEEHQKKIAEMMGSSNSRYAGQVGKNVDDVMAVLSSGNLREQMTAVYNAMFGPFKQIVTDIIKGSDWDDATSRGIDVRKMKIRQRQLKWNPMARFKKWVKKDKEGTVTAKESEIYRDPRRGVTDRKKAMNFDYDLLKSKDTRLMTSEKPEEQVTNRKVGELEEGPHKAGLSEREKALMFPGREGDDLSDETLKWEEGGSKWKADDRAPWVQKAKNSLRMPVFAGPSGTALRFFQIYEWFGKPVKPEDLRLALLGWMLVENDHSFHEIMSMTEDYGLPYTPGHEAYRDVKPITVAELRKNACLDAKYPGMFPDEIAYYRKIDKGGYALMNPYIGDNEYGAQHTPMAEEQFGLKQSEYEGSGLNKLMTSAAAYTTIAYQIQNIVANSSPRVATMRINDLMSRIKKYVKAWMDANNKAGDLDNPKHAALWYADYQNDKVEMAKLNFAEKNMLFVLTGRPDLTAEELIEETKEHNKFTQRAMNQLPRYTGKVYRGEANPLRMGYKKGSSFTLKKFLSASRLTTQAEFYANQSAGIKDQYDDKNNKTGQSQRWYSKFMKRVVLEIHSKSARDVNAVTVNEDINMKYGGQAASLDEVVFLPGTTLTVQSDPEVRTGQFGDIPVVKIVEQGYDDKAPQGSAMGNDFEFSLFKGTDSGTAKKDDQDDQDDGQLGKNGPVFEVVKLLNYGQNLGYADMDLDPGEKFEVSDKLFPIAYDNMPDEGRVTSWASIVYKGRTYYVNVYDLYRNARPAGVPDKLPEKPKTPADPFANIPRGKTGPYALPANTTLSVVPLSKKGMIDLKYDEDKLFTVNADDKDLSSDQVVRINVEAEGEEYFALPSDLFDTTGDPKFALSGDSKDDSPGLQGRVYEVKAGIEAAINPPNSDEYIDAGEQFVVLDDKYPEGYAEIVGGARVFEWVKINWKGKELLANLYDMDKNVQLAAPKRPDTPIPEESDESELDNPGGLPLPEVDSVHVLKSPLAVRRQRGGQAVIPAGIKIKVLEVEDEDNITVTSERVGIDFITGKTDVDAFHAAMVSPKLDVVEQVEEDVDEETSTDTEIDNEDENDVGGEFPDDNLEVPSFDWEDVRKAYEKVLDQCQLTNGLQMEIKSLMSNGGITPRDVKLALMFKEDAASEFAAEQGELTADEFIQFAEKT